eukprot:TRINITY_DN202_c0_g1_i1.p1 TRINITY_DN202_c0_g1~~TRINITY_DN202_c0_g1_i1.p1  ORF type:complete len:369 (-),score=54.55 TRINITY_DN202_c0_g1_i1:1188-2294(-)
MGRAGLPFLLVVFFAVFVATYNSVNMVSNYYHRTKLASADGVRSGRRMNAFFDPVVRMPQTLLDGGKKKRLYHVAVTANDSPYNRWQSRIMYYWYKKFKDDPESEMGGFTRILHDGRRDSVMDEIPTVVVDPLPPGQDRGYVVLNRPWAFVQWLNMYEVEEDYILMGEPDHIFIRPLPNLATEEMPAAFPFFYIAPGKHEDVLRKFYPKSKGPISHIDPIGNSPVIIKKEQLKKIAPTWMNISLAMKDDPETDKAFGWVLEMYGYATAAALHDVAHILHKDFMLQPPFDTKLGDAYIIHYTYGCDYTMKGVLTYGTKGEWRFDKRSFTGGAPPRGLPTPPPGVPETVVTLVRMVNEATANIPNWEEGS